MVQLKCMKVLICSDNMTRKAEIKALLNKEGVCCVTYDAELSSNESVGLHFSSVPRHTQCRDVAVEVGLMAKYCKGLLCTRSNMCFMVAVLAGSEHYEVIDMVNGLYHVTATVSETAAASVFKSDLDNDVDGMWLDHATCVVQILGKENTRDFFSVLQGYVINLKKLEDYEVESNVSATDGARGYLRGFLSAWNLIQVVKITKFDPARAGWGAAQNAKVRKHATALSVLVSLLLDKHSGECQDNFISDFCKVAAAHRPAA